MQYADVATWGELRYLKTRLEKQVWDIGAHRDEVKALIEWHEGDTKRKFLDKNGKIVLMKFTFEKAEEEIDDK